MHFIKKIGSWLTDYTFILRGAVATIIYQKPPHHYLGHIVRGKVPVILDRVERFTSISEEVSKHATSRQGAFSETLLFENTE